MATPPMLIDQGVGARMRLEIQLEPHGTDLQLAIEAEKAWPRARGHKQVQPVVHGVAVADAEALKEA